VAIKTCFTIDFPTVKTEGYRVLSLSSILTGVTERRWEAAAMLAIKE